MNSLLFLTALIGATLSAPLLCPTSPETNIPELAKDAPVVLTGEVIGLDTQVNKTADDGPSPHVVVDGMVKVKSITKNTAAPCIPSALVVVTVVLKAI